jgi:hypothetical protein
MYPAAAAGEKDALPGEFTPAEFRRYTDFAARLNLMFTGGTIASRVAVLHPIRSVWAHFTPSDRSMYEPHPDPVVRFIDGAFSDLCRNLIQNQIGFDIVDERSIERARVEGSSLLLGDRRYSLLVIPPMDTLRLGTMETIGEFAGKGGAVLAHPLLPSYASDGPEKDAQVRALTDTMRRAGSLGGSTPDAPPLVYLIRSRVVPDCHCEPATPDIICARIERKRGTAFFLVNSSAREYEGMVTFRAAGQPVLMDPVTGSETAARAESPGGEGVRIRLTLKSFASIFVSFGETG